MKLYRAQPRTSQRRGKAFSYMIHEAVFPIFKSGDCFEKSHERKRENVSEAERGLMKYNGIVFSGLEFAEKINTSPNRRVVR